MLAPDDVLSGTGFASGSFSISNPAPMNTLRFYGSGQTLAVTIDLKSGEVTLADHMTPDEAARIFWEAVRRAFPIKQDA